MPVEIRELHIRVTVNAGGEEKKPAGKLSGPSAAQGAAGETARESMIAECVEKVMEILQNKSER
jgi:hypothetical protein